LPALPRLQLFAVDAWAPAEVGDSYYESGAHDAFFTPEQFEEVRATYRRRCARWMDRVVELRGDLVEMATHITKYSLDFVFLDADHSEEGTLQALRAWAPKVKPGGWVLLHDLGPTSKFEGPELAAQEYFGRDFARGQQDVNHTWAWQRPLD
jgi:predicted O-methyltransferase YrrM